MFLEYPTAKRQSSRRGSMVRRLGTYEAHERRKREKRKLANGKSNQVKIDDTNPQLALILKIAPYYERKRHVPYELMLKIFHHVVRTSNHPIKDLCNLAGVCEAWRLVILQSPSLWSRIDFNELPLTDGNMKVLRTLFERLPTVIRHVEEVSLSGRMNFKHNESTSFLISLISAPNIHDLCINSFDPQCKLTVLSSIARAICTNTCLKRLSIKNTRDFFANQKWLVEFLMEHGSGLEELHLTSSLRSVSSQLIRSLASDYCPSLRVLDLSTCDFLCNHSFDAIAISQTMPNLRILRVANVSFRRVLSRPEILCLTKLEELSMPISMRDADRDDALFATLAYGSNHVTSLDLRGSSITAHALRSLPSCNMRELHIDDLCPLDRKFYGNFLARWQHSLEVVSLVKINCSLTIRSCLESLVGKDSEPHIKELDLESSDVTEDDLKWFLTRASSLQAINLSSCRSLPRGCKGKYTRTSYANFNQSLDGLKRRLKVMETHSDSDTEIDDTEVSSDSMTDMLPAKRRRIAPKRPDYVYLS